jgi:hypothetical protein
LVTFFTQAKNSYTSKKSQANKKKKAYTLDILDIPNILDKLEWQGVGSEPAQQK